MSIEFQPDFLTTPLLTTGEVARLARVEVDTFAQWQKPGRKALGEFGEMTAAGRRLYSLDDAVLLRVAVSLIAATGAGPSEAAAAARGVMDELARIAARPVPADPGERIAALFFNDAEGWRWFAATKKWIAAALLRGSPPEPELVVPIEEMRDGVVRAAIIHALSSIEFDEQAPRGAPSLAARLQAAGLRNAELSGKIAREKAGKK